VDTSQRLACSRQLTAAEAAQWSDPAFVLGGWVPATVNAAVAGATVSVNWSAPPGHAAADVIALCKIHDLRCAAVQSVGTTANSGTVTVALPQFPGIYQVRYYANGHVTAASAAFPVAGPE
jgi:hypothetical protein